MANFQTRGFAVVPYQLMDSAPINLRAYLFSVYLVLHRRGWNSAHGCWASVHTIQEDAGVGRKSIHAALHWLLSEGWVTREERPGFTSVYRVRVEDPLPAPRPERRQSEATQVKNDPGQKRPDPQVKNDPGPRPKMTHKQEPITRTQEQEPPISPKPQTAPSEPEPKPARTRIKLTEADIPESLQPVAALVVQFWNHAKGGQRTQRALTGQLRELEAIARDRRGGLQAVRQQLEKAVTAAEIGSAWRGITHARWLEFGLGHGQQAETRPSLPTLPPMTPEEAAHMRLLQNPPPTVFGRR